jgi:phage shock protein C
MMRKRIFRSTTDKVIGGVCGGLGEYFNMDPTWIRILFVIAIFAKGVGLLAYLICWIVFPKKSDATIEATVTDDSGETVTSATVGGGENHQRGGGFLPGIILVVLGMIFLLDQAFYWFDFDYIWPLLLIGIGAILIYRATNPRTESSNSESAANDGNLEVGNGGR